MPPLEVVETTLSRAGERQYWRVIKFPMKDVAGKYYLGGIAVDVTGRMQAEEAVRRAEQRYRSIFENAVEGIFQTTWEGRYLTLNPALVRMYGYVSGRADGQRDGYWPSNLCRPASARGICSIGGETRVHHGIRITGDS